MDGSDIGEVMIKPTEEAVTETWVIATLVVPTVEEDIRIIGIIAVAKHHSTLTANSFYTSGTHIKIATTT